MFVLLAVYRTIQRNLRGSTVAIHHCLLGKTCTCDLKREVNDLQIATALRREGLPAPNVLIVSNFPSPQTPMDVRVPFSLEYVKSA